MGWKILFWFLSLNLLFFLPLTLINFEGTSFFPFSSFFTGHWFEFFRAFFIRSNHDLFRLSVDLLLIVLLYVALRKRVKARHYRWFMFPVFLSLLAFTWYSQVFFYLFQQPPALFNDAKLLLLSKGIIQRDGLWLLLLGCLFLGIAGAGLFFWVSKGLHWIESHQFRRVHGALLILLLLPILLSLHRFGIKRMRPENTFQVSSFYVLENLRISFALQKQQTRLADIELEPNRPYPLAKRPNLYFLIVESYGSFVLDHDAGAMIRLLETVDEDLRNEGWSSASAWSRSPTFGGGSSAAFATLLHGFDFASYGTYDFALKDPRFIECGHLLNRLATSGYTNFRLSSLPDKGMPIPWDHYTAFYAVHEWIKYDDLNYTGKLYGFGPTPPDQFALEKAREIVRQHPRGPYTLFYITQNSHSPFAYPPLAAAWQELDDGSQERIRFSSFLVRPELEDYRKAMDYQLRMLSAFIRNETEEAIFVLVGDHQPPIIAQRGDGFFTPLHIITRDRRLLHALPTPFQEGMKPPDRQVLHHRDFQGYFEKALLEVYKQTAGDVVHAAGPIQP